MRGKMSSFITIRLPRCYTTRETLTLFTKLKSLCSRKLVKSKGPEKINDELTKFRRDLLQKTRQISSMESEISI